MVSSFSYASHSQAAVDTIPDLYKQEWKRLALVQKWLNQTQAFLGRVIPGGWVVVSGMKVRSLVGLSLHSPLVICLVLHVYCCHQIN